jgi:hypothetical protein
MYIINIILISICLIYVIYVYINIYNLNDILKKLPADYFKNLINKPEPIFDYSPINLDMLLNEIEILQQKIDIEKSNTITLRNSNEIINKQINIQETNIYKLHEDIDKLRYDILTLQKFKI